MLPKAMPRWSLRLLAEKVVEAGFCDSVSHTFVANVLKKTLVKPASEPNLVHRQRSMPPFLARMERILALYALPYDPRSIPSSASMNAPVS